MRPGTTTRTSTGSTRGCNVSDQPVDLSLFRVQTRSGTNYALPKMMVPPGHTVMVHSGKGSYQDDPRFQLEAYLGSDTPIWDDSYDVITLVDQEGRTVDQRPSK